MVLDEASLFLCHSHKAIGIVADGDDAKPLPGRELLAKRRPLNPKTKAQLRIGAVQRPIIGIKRFDKFKWLHFVPRAQFNSGI